MNLTFLALLSAPYIYDISRLRVKGARPWKIEPFRGRLVFRQGCANKHEFPLRSSPT